MRRTAVVLTLWLLLISSSEAVTCTGEDVFTRNGFATGQTLVDASDGDVTSYLAGYLDGILVANVLGARPECVDKAWGCMDGRNITQLVAILRKYLNDNPDKWHIAANVLSYNAIISPCFAE